MLSLVSLFLNASSSFVVSAILFLHFHPKLSALECVACGIPMGIVLSAWCGLLVKSLLISSPGLTPTMIFVCVLAHLTAAVPSFVKLRSRWRSSNTASLVRQELLDRHTRYSLGFLSLIWLWLCWNLHTHCLRPEGTNSFHVAGTTWADLPFHLNIVSSFLHGVNVNATVFQPLQSAFYANSTLAYPFLPDFHIAYNVAAGSSLREAMVMPGAFLLGSFVLLLYRFGYRLTQDHVAACAAIPLTFCCGGIGFYHLWQKWTWNNFMTKDHIFHLVGAPDAFWFSLPAHIIYPQRTTQFAYPMDIVIMLLLFATQTRVTVHSKKTDDPDPDPYSASPSHPILGTAAASCLTSSSSSSLSTGPYSSIGNSPVQGLQKLKLLCAAGIATGLLPFLQPHSFVAVGSVVLVVAILDVVSQFRATRSMSKPVWSAIFGWIAYGIVAFTIALPQFIPFFGRVAHSSGFIRWNRWTFAGLFHQWARSLGLYVPLFLVSVLLIRRSRFDALQFYFGLLTVFIEANLIIFQPWEMDNTKVFYVWVFGASAFVCLVLRRVASKLGVLGLVLVALVYVSLTISGATLNVQESINSAQMFDAVDVEYADWIRQNTPSDAVFLTPNGHYPRHSRVESALAGRQILTGYAGWLSSHGLDYGTRMNRQDQIMTGRGDAYKWLHELGVTHITVPWSERKKFNMEFLNSIGNRVSSNGRYSVYEVRRGELLEQPKDCKQNTRESCRSAGCVWLPGFKGPYCHMPHYKIAKEEPVDCGFPGVTEPDCHDRWCSWHPGATDGTPWCVKPHHAGATHYKPMRLLSDDGDCGWNGIEVPQCEDRGCTWAPAGVDPWCTFHRNVERDGPPPTSIDLM